MDRTLACEAGNVGSIPTESTKIRSTFCALEQANCFACVLESNSGTIFFQQEKWVSWCPDFAE